MKRKRIKYHRRNPGKKYEYLVVLQGYYGHGWEDLFSVTKKVSGFDPEASRQIRQVKKEYVQNAPGAYRIINRKERK